MEEVNTFVKTSSELTQAVRMDLHMGGEVLTDHAQTVRANASASIGGDDIPTCLDTSYIVRRLTPLECERLMGYPDNYTRIPYRGKPADECPDSPRYKACGNGWAINCARWVLQGIDRYLRSLNNG